MNNGKQVLGIIGGLGPGATARFMELTLRMTDARSDQEHLDMIIFNCTSIPDRSGYILDPTLPNPLPPMLEIGAKLAQQGADHIAILCMTAHYFYEELCREIPVPVINGIEETVLHLKKKGITRVGIMATDGNIRSGLFQRELERQGMVPVVPSAGGQQDVMHLIYGNIKAGQPAEMDRFHSVRRELQEKGAQVIILGCTELSLIKRDEHIGPGFIDAMEVLAQQAVIRCGAGLKPEYQSLITT